MSQFDSGKKSANLDKVLANLEDEIDDEDDEVQGDGEDDCGEEEDDVLEENDEDLEDLDDEEAANNTLQPVRTVLIKMSDKLSIFVYYYILIMT